MRRGERTPGISLPDVASTVCLFVVSLTDIAARARSPCLSCSLGSNEGLNFRHPKTGQLLDFANGRSDRI